jgi:hypothetical protein
MRPCFGGRLVKSYSHCSAWTVASRGRGMGTEQAAIDSADGGEGVPIDEKKVACRHPCARICSRRFYRHKRSVTPLDAVRPSPRRSEGLAYRAEWTPQVGCERRIAVIAKSMIDMITTQPASPTRRQGNLQTARGGQERKAEVVREPRS